MPELLIAILIMGIIFIATASWRGGSETTITFSPKESATPGPSEVGSIWVEAVDDKMKLHILECDTATSRVRID